MTTCSEVRDAVSAGLDGEDPGLSQTVIDSHLQGCDQCRGFAARVGALHRSMRVTAAPAVPDLSVPILAAIGADEGETTGVSDKRDLLPRFVLALAGALQLALSLPALVLGDDAGLPVHAARHIGSFGAALAVGFLYVAWKPSRVTGLLPVMTALVVCLVGSSVADAMAGTTPALTEAPHLAEIVGVAAMWLLAHPTPHRSRRIVTT
jgi:predicted anti-sigma-YlaC factor YlaD